MRRFRVLLAVCSLFLFAPGLAISTLAQDATPDSAAHPLEGTWIIYPETEPDEPPSVTIFAPGGGVIDTSSDGSTGLGAWAATGPATADVGIWNLFEGGMAIIRASIEVAADGQTFSGTYTIEFVPDGGESTGQYGPAQVTGERIAAEGPGETAGTFEDLFSQFATPETSLTGEVVQIDLQEYAILSDHLTLTAGVEYVFVVTNSGSETHELVIEPAGAVDEPLEANGVESEIEDIAPGATGELAWTFDEPGMYQFSCHVTGHFEAGMVLEFEVVAP